MNLVNELSEFIQYSNNARDIRKALKLINDCGWKMEAIMTFSIVSKTANTELIDTVYKNCGVWYKECDYDDMDVSEVIARRNSMETLKYMLKNNFPVKRLTAAPMIKMKRYHLIAYMYERGYRFSNEDVTEAEKIEDECISKLVNNNRRWFYY